MVIDKKNSESLLTAFLFIIIPTIMLVIGFFLYPFLNSEYSTFIIEIPIILALILLGFGFLFNNFTGNKLKILGWMTFAFFWATQPLLLYYSEDKDIINTIICVIGVYVLSYIAYHEWLSLERKEKISCLNWIAGAACIAGIIYYGIERTPLQFWLREVVANHSAWFLNLVTGGGVSDRYFITFKDFTVSIIFACTGVQAMVIFVGMILPLKKVESARKIIGLLITVVPIYVLNFMRNALVAFLVGNNITDFSTAHNYVAKAGALIVLVVLLLIVSRVIPEIFDEIIGITNLYKRKGPLERLFSKKKENKT